MHPQTLGDPWTFWVGVLGLAVIVVTEIALVIRKKYLRRKKGEQHKLRVRQSPRPN